MRLILSYNYVIYMTRICDQIDFSVYKMKLFIFELLIKIKYRSTENNIYTFEMKLYLCMKYV